MKNLVKLSVRTLAESLRSGDLNLEPGGAARSVDGVRAHQKLQGERPEGYEKEYAVACRVEEDDVTLEIQGRIDGVLDTLVEEIKTTAGELPAEGKTTHWGQLEIYCCLYAREKELDTVQARLTYYSLDTGETRELDRTYQRDELESRFREILARFLKGFRRHRRRLIERNASLRAASFPFARYRPGQREMAVSVYRALRDGGELLLQAPTGIGKTQATLFPAIKVLAEGECDKLFYLTARTTGRALAEKAVGEIGSDLKSVTLTAKEKICFNPDRACNGDECAFARGFYDRLDAAIEDALARNVSTRAAVEEVAARHQVCPFELSLELTLWVDLVICDYNYAFDPRAYLRRLFDPPTKLDFGLLVDEAHNLVDRARSMFSAELRKTPFLALRRQVGRSASRGLHRALSQVNAELLTLRKGVTESADASPTEVEPPAKLLEALKRFVSAAEPVLASTSRADGAPWRPELLELTFEALRFLKVAEDWGSEYVTCYEPRGRDLEVTLFCSDPSRRLSERLETAKASVFFSATLTPPGYFTRLFGCREETTALRFSSPFPSENLAVLVASHIATTYHRRAGSRDALTELLVALSEAKEGRYLFYFPSYAYLNAVHERFVAARPGLAVQAQRPDMTEAERTDFVSRFEKASHSLVGFAVMGGVFGEGIDLPGDRLTGAAVVGVGLPPPSPRREHIRAHFDRERGAGLGFDYAYVYPGINRVLQAAGRVIRSEQDRGALLLVDERFARRSYGSLLPPEWTAREVRGPEEVRDHLARFWDRVTSPATISAPTAAAST